MNVDGKSRDAQSPTGGNMNAKLKAIFAVLALGVVTVPVYGDVVTTKTVTTTTYREDAPIYTGPVMEADLEELTLGDFQTIVTNPSQAARQYYEYKNTINDPEHQSAVLYKMKVTRDLTVADFQNSEISLEKAQTRYQAYTTMRAKPGDTYYVYVYHAPLAPLVPVMINQ